MFHLDVRRIVKGVGDGGAVGFGRYLARERFAREQQPSDLRALEHAHLPPWAQDDPQHYFAMAQRYESKNGIIARLYEVSLPRALSLEAQQDLVHDIQETLFTRHPVAWALHVPVASDGQAQPHVHFMVSERTMDGVERGVKRFFRKAAAVGRDPAEGGARKDLSWGKHGRIADVRLAVAVLTNAALERAGVQQAVSPWSLRAQGFDRAVLQYANAGQRAVVEAERQWLRVGQGVWEQAWQLEAWRQYKAEHQIRDISREAMVDVVREMFWRGDQSVWRQRERWEAVERALVRAQAQHLDVPRGTSRSRPLVEHAMHLNGYEDRAEGGVHVRLHDVEHER
jgi:hypothetical protein